MSDWNGDGLNDNWDEAHEFGIDLDGEPGIDGDGPDGGFGGGFDSAVVDLLDAADLLGADLVDLSDVAERPWAMDLDLTELNRSPVPLPVGAEFIDLLTSLGDEPLPLPDLLGFVAGLEVVNPFTVDAAD